MIVSKSRKDCDTFLISVTNSISFPLGGSRQFLGATLWNTVHVLCFRVPGDKLTKPKWMEFWPSPPKMGGAVSSTCRRQLLNRCQVKSEVFHCANMADIYESTFSYKFY